MGEHFGTILVCVFGVFVLLLSSNVASYSNGAGTARSEIKDRCLLKKEIVLYSEYKPYKFKCEFVGETE